MSEQQPQTDETMPVRRPVTVIPHPIPISPPGPGPRPFRPRPGLRVGIVGRLSPWKGQDVFLRAFAVADLPTPSSAVLIGSAMFGEEEYERSLHRLAEDLGITDRVDFRGFVDDVPRLLPLDLDMDPVATH